MELQQELLWKIVERELGMGLISCEPLNAGGSADVYRATVKGAAYCLYQTVSLGRRGGDGTAGGGADRTSGAILNYPVSAPLFCARCMQRRRNRSKRLGWN